MKADEPLARIAGDYLVICAPWGEYDPPLARFQREPVQSLRDMREKNWWTAEHERELVELMGMEWMQKATEGDTR